MSHARKWTKAEMEAETRDRWRKIRADRIRKNTHEWRKFQMGGFVRAWEFGRGKRMPEPDMELEPQAFREWLGVDHDWELGCTPLESWVRARIKVYVAGGSWLRARKLLHGVDSGKRRQARLVIACPRWADRLAIRDIYRQAREMGPGYHVDHYYPLLGERVSGLHVVENLRIITAAENCAKKNKMPIDG